ncbi:hypothetical protein L207DRAFT_576908 [Hyaloscypha variabilis F]|uniref:2EXR domain-containing protein n=1 Tax=Hyaloscypha variabilis (strain UAMH 11265 / GT02V1 / F) TaxID=1149755 RepID=A0A2J6S5J0_HYAVF|nr:hypothetical protein L207DRAFT_576908 [Hyaloscypha variabilis F]
MATTTESAATTSQPDLEVTATSFTLFPKLPKEIHLNIWHNAFPPPRIVRLDRKWDRAKFPVTLWVNVESRAETLMHYRVALNQDLRIAGFDWVADFVKGQDIASFNSRGVLRYYARFVRTLFVLRRHFGGGLRTIQQLEITSIGSAIVGEGLDKVVSVLRVLLLGFTALKTVTFIGRNVWQNPAFLEKFECFEKDMNLFFAAHKGHWGRTGSPKVVFIELDTMRK